MSIKMMTIVFDRYPFGGGEMLLALALADHANDNGESIRPSIRSLAEKTRQSERTVQYQLRKMEEHGWLVLVNHGNGGRNMHREYHISPDWIKGAEIAPIKRVQSEAKKGATDDIKGCNPRHKRVQSTTEKGAIAVAPASNRHRTVIEPSINHIGDGEKKTRSSKLSINDLIADGVEHQTAADFLEIRLAKKAPLTKTALDAIKLEADKAGYPLENAIRECVLRGWQGFKADWVLRDARPVAQSATSKPSLDNDQPRNYGRSGKL